MARLFTEFRHAARALVHSPAFAVVSILTLALGIGANTAVFSLLNAVFLRPLPYEAPDRLVLVWESAPFFGLDDSPVSPANFVDWKERAQSFEQMGGLEVRRYRLAGEGPAELVKGADVTAGVFRALRTRPLLGRVFREEDDQLSAPKVVILSEGLWRARFGADQAVIGKRIRLDKVPHTVIGVLASGTEPPSPYLRKLGDVWTPLGASYSAQQWNNRGRHNWMVIARLKSGVTRAQADSEMRAIGQSLAKQYPGTNEKVGAFVAPLREHFVRGSRRLFLLLSGTVGLVLLIACSNLANLLLTRSAGRSREVVLRRALGAGAWNLARQFLCESLLVTATGGLLGLLLARTTFRFLANFAPSDMAGMQTLTIDGRVLAYTAVLSMAVAVAFSLIPLWHVRRLDLIDSLKCGSRTLTAAHSNFARMLLAGSQVALAFTLATGAALLIQTLVRVRGEETGFRTANLLTVDAPRRGESRPTPVEIANWQRDVLQRILAIPGVVTAGFTNHLPIAAKGDITSVNTEGRSERDRVQSRARVAGPGYLAAMGMTVLRGRVLGESDVDGAPRVALVNQALARELWPGLDPLGRRLIFGRDSSAEVVGIVKDIRQERLDEPAKPEFYVSSLQAGFHPSSLAIHTQVPPESIARAVRQAIASVDPEQPVAEILTMDEVLDREVVERRRQGLLLSVFAGLAVLMAALGLYGVLAYSVGQSRPEFALRMALGAAPGTLLARVVGRGLALTIAGVAAGCAAAAALSRLLKAFLYGVEPVDPAAYAAIGLVLLGAAAMASYLPARRAMQVDPAEALRAD
ncbi:MAG: ABC transporter permease [Acidobacteria bacterium]|nr:ABC transporter permease [Acidobacteriota bacterium]